MFVPGVDGELQEKGCVHPNCDGWIMRPEHPTDVDHEGILWRPYCQYCDWRGFLTSDKRNASRDAKAHTATGYGFRRCDGRCRDWFDDAE